MSLLKVENLVVEYGVKRGLLRPAGHVRAVDGVSFAIGAGETLGLVGESGCGKSSLARALVRLVKAQSGHAWLQSPSGPAEDLLALSGEKLRKFRKYIQIIFQDPFNSLNPRMTVAEIVGEAFDVHGVREHKAARQARVADLLRSVGLDATIHAERYPHEFSGGQRQRIGIARALAVEAHLLICDEPVSALDVSVQAQIINLLRDLQQERGISYLFIAHDLAVVEHLSDRVMVMYLGSIVEQAEARTLLRAPRHPYTRALISTAPTLDSATRRERIVLTGDVPSPLVPPSGCRFHPRCPRAELPLCAREVPGLEEAGTEHWSACHFRHEAGGKIS